MSKYIDADLYVEMQIYDDEHEEWSIWNGTIEELLDQWTEEGCPPTIEVSEDCISKAYLEQEIENQIMPAIDREMYWRGWNNALGKVVELIEDAPSVVPSRAEGEWTYHMDEVGSVKTVSCALCGGWVDITIPEQTAEFAYCPYCGAKMKEAE